MINTFARSYSITLGLAWLGFGVAVAFGYDLGALATAVACFITAAHMFEQG